MPSLASGHSLGTNSPFSTPPPPKVPYEVYRADHSCLVTVLPVNASVRDILRALGPQLGPEGDHILVKVNSAGGEAAPVGVPPCQGSTCPPQG